MLVAELGFKPACLAPKTAFLTLPCHLISPTRWLLFASSSGHRLLSLRKSYWGPPNPSQEPLLCAFLCSAVTALTIACGMQNRGWYSSSTQQGRQQVAEYIRVPNHQLCVPPGVQHRYWLQVLSSHRHTTRTLLQVRTSTTI